MPDNSNHPWRKDQVGAAAQKPTRKPPEVCRHCGDTGRDPITGGPCEVCGEAQAHVVR
jgi:hypothetical protein